MRLRTGRFLACFCVVLLASCSPLEGGEETNTPADTGGEGTGTGESPALRKFFAPVLLETSAYQTIATGQDDQMLRFIESQLARGHLDAHKVRFDARVIDISLFHDVVLWDEAGSYIQVHSDEWHRFPRSFQRFILTEIKNRYYGITAYQVRVKRELNNLQDQPLASALGNRPEELPEIFEAEQLLSAFVKRWALEPSGREGPNCYFAAIASVSNVFTTPRYMSEGEFSCYMGQYFSQIPKADRLGDILILFDENGMLQHAATYLGKDQGQRDIYFSKNGKQDGYYLYVDFQTLTEKLYQNSRSVFVRMDSLNTVQDGSFGQLCSTEF